MPCTYERPHAQGSSDPQRRACAHCVNSPRYYEGDPVSECVMAIESELRVSQQTTDIQRSRAQGAFRHAQLTRPPRGAWASEPRIHADYAWDWPRVATRAVRDAVRESAVACDTAGHRRICVHLIILISRRRLSDHWRPAPLRPQPVRQALISAPARLKSACHLGIVSGDHLGGSAARGRLGIISTSSRHHLGIISASSRLVRWARLPTATKRRGRSEAGGVKSSYVKASQVEVKQPSRGVAQRLGECSQVMSRQGEPNHVKSRLPSAPRRSLH